MIVSCVWVKAQVPYSVEYVVNLRAMVARHLQRPHKFCCLTDRPDQLPAGIEPIPIYHERGLFGWWAKRFLFSPTMLPGRVLYLDLDTVVVAPLDPIVDYPASFALIPHAGTFNGKDGKAVVKRFNSSVMVWDAGVNAHIYENWTPAVAQRLWGDQDHIGEQCPDAATMPAAWFPRLSSLKETPPMPPVKVVLAKVPKNDVAADLYPWVRQAWRAA